MAISRFKATCLEVVERVRRTGTRVIITKRGEPVAEVGPITPPPAPDPWIGSMRESGTIRGDLVAPIADAGDWEGLS